MAKGNPNPNPEQRWKKGQSGNPAGRAPGPSKQKLIEMGVEARLAELSASGKAGELLKAHAQPIIQEILKIALNPEPKPSQAKVKCLIACIERLVPALKSIQVAEPGQRQPGELSDEEIVELMQRMVNMAQSNGNPPGGNPLH